MDKKTNTTVERIVQFIEFKGISKREFASKVGISHSLIGKANSIGSDKLEKILSVYPEINPIWLITGKEVMKKLKFEYQTVYFGAHEMDALKMRDFLHRQGQEGWDLVHILTKPYINEPWNIANYTFIFKRVINT